MLLVALAACVKPQEAAPPWKTIDAPTLKSMMASGKNISVYQHDERARVPRSPYPGHAVPGLRGDRKQRLRPAGRQGPRSSSSTVKAKAATGAVVRPMPPSVTATNRCTFWQAGYRPGSRRDIPWKLSSASPGCRSVSVRAQDLKKMLTERKDLLLVDIRSEKSFGEGHIEGAVNIPLYRFSQQLRRDPAGPHGGARRRPGLPDLPGGKLPGAEGLQGDAPLWRHAGLAGNEGSEVTGIPPEPNGWNR